ncbi:MAG: iron-containing alcohol dehydrogenase [Paracoccaceae bacterium]
MSDFGRTLREMLEGRWRNPETALVDRPLPIADIRLMDTTDGAEADLIAPLDLGRSLAVVSDPRTHDAMGGRVARALGRIATVTDVVIEAVEATDEEIAALAGRTTGADALVAVGSGTLQDIVKHATFLDGRPFATFATAASMAGYTSVTASVTRGGMKLSLPSHLPRGLFLDIGVAARAPRFLAQAGLGDCLCRTTAQVDWRLSAALLGTPYREVPFLMQAPYETHLLAEAKGIGTGAPEAIETLYAMLLLVGLGSVYTGTSHHGSMSEHLVSHWIDMFAGPAHPGTTHGMQVGFASVSMSRLQHLVLDADAPPDLREMRIDEAAIRARYGPGFADAVLSAFRAKQAEAGDPAGLRARMEDWESFREGLRAVMLPTEVLVRALDDAGAPATAAAARLARSVYRDALLHAREIRNRYSILDVAADSGVLAGFAEAEAGWG